MKLRSVCAKKKSGLALVEDDDLRRRCGRYCGCRETRKSYRSVTGLVSQLKSNAGDISVCLKGECHIGRGR